MSYSLDSLKEGIQGFYVGDCGSILYARARAPALQHRRTRTSEVEPLETSLHP